MSKVPNNAFCYSFGKRSQSSYEMDGIAVATGSTQYNESRQLTTLEH